MLPEQEPTPAQALVNVSAEQGRDIVRSPSAAEPKLISLFKNESVKNEVPVAVRLEDSETQANQKPIRAETPEQGSSNHKETAGISLKPEIPKQKKQEAAAQSKQEQTQIEPQSYQPKVIVTKKVQTFGISSGTAEAPAVTELAIVDTESQPVPELNIKTLEAVPVPAGPSIETDKIEELEEIGEPTLPIQQVKLSIEHKVDASTQDVTKLEPGEINNVINIESATPVKIALATKVSIGIKAVPPQKMLEHSGLQQAQSEPKGSTRTFEQAKNNGITLSKIDSELPAIAELPIIETPSAAALETKADEIPTELINETVLIKQETESETLADLVAKFDDETEAPHKQSPDRKIEIVFPTKVLEFNITDDRVSETATAIESARQDRAASDTLRPRPTSISRPSSRPNFINRNEGITLRRISPTDLQQELEHDDEYLNTRLNERTATAALRLAA
jgi:hypothetical protein